METSKSFMTLQRFSGWNPLTGEHGAGRMDVAATVGRHKARLMLILNGATECVKLFGGTSRTALSGHIHELAAQGVRLNKLMNRA